MSASVLTVSPEGGAEVSVDFEGGSAYSDKALTTPVSLPDVIDAPTVYYVDDAAVDAMTVIVSSEGVEIIRRGLRPLFGAYSRRSRILTVGSKDVDLEEAQAGAFGGGDSGTSASVKFDSWMSLGVDNAPQTIPNAATTPLLFDTVEVAGIDDADLTPPTLPGAAITVENDGLYVVGFGVQWEDNADGQRLLTLVTTPASDFWNVVSGSAAGTHHVTITPTPTDFYQDVTPTVVPLRAGTTVAVSVMQNSGGALDVLYANLSIGRVA